MTQSDQPYLGGRAPPKTTVPGCGNYVGTATYTPDYMPGWGPNGASATPTQTALNSVANPTETGFSQAPGGDVTSEGQTLTGLPTMTQLVTGTGAPAGSANGTATFSTGAPSQPSGTGNAAAAVMGFAGQGVVGLAGLVAGLVVL